MVNISNANTEAYYRFIKFHEDLNDIIKVNTASIQTFKRITSVINGSELIGSLIDSCEKPWKKNAKYPTFDRIIDNSINNNSNLYLVYVLTGFDWFTFNLIKDINLFSNSLRPHIHNIQHIDFLNISNINFDESSNCCYKEATKFTKRYTLKPRINKIKTILSINNTEFDKYATIFNFIRAIRNCIAHSNSYPSEELLQIYGNSRYQQLLISDHLMQKYLPAVSKNLQIVLKEEHALYSSNICLKLAKIINEEAIKSFDLYSVIKQIFYYKLYLGLNIEGNAKYRDFYNLILQCLHSRYKVKGVDRNCLVNLIKKGPDYITIKNMVKP